jgi:hypothetical protein
MNPLVSAMKYALIAGAALLLPLTATPALAQWIPSGSYARTCTNIQLYGGQVVADCRGTDGNWNRTTLHGADRCVGGLANIDGRLACNDGRLVGSRDDDQRHGYGHSRDYGGDYRHGGNYWDGSGYDRGQEYGWQGTGWQGYDASGDQPYGYYHGYGQ